jgi:hypothetical protein
MNIDRRLKPAVLAIVVLLAAAAAVTSGAAAVPARPDAGGPRNPALAAAPDPGAPVPGGPGYLMVNPFQFRSAFPDRGWGYENGELSNPGPEENFFEAPVTLPNNVTITNMVAYFYDNTDQGLAVGIWRIDPSTGSWLQMASVSSSGAQDQYRNAANASIIEPAVDQQSYSYLIEAHLPVAWHTLRLAGVRIDYAYTTGLPIVSKAP